MSKKIYLHLLFFCGIFCQGIFATLSDKDTSSSSNFLVRKRRVTNHLPNGRNAIPIQSVSYIVRVREASRTICAGAILSHYTVITATLCVIRHPHMSHEILSGATADRNFKSHNVTSIESHSGNPPYHLLNSISLLIVDPPFVYSAKTGSIQLYAGPVLPAGTHVTVYGWGYVYPPQAGLESRQKLRAIFLPIMNFEQCKHFENYRLTITDKHICTSHPQQHCCRNDEGAPLVFGNQLVGIHVLKDENPHQLNPDIYINLQRPEYRDWIQANTLLM